MVVFVGSAMKPAMRNAPLPFHPSSARLIFNSTPVETSAAEPMPPLGYAPTPFTFELSNATANRPAVPQG